MSEIIAQAAQSAVQASQGKAEEQTFASGTAQAPASGAPEAPKPAESPKEDYSERIAQMARRERRMQEESKAQAAKFKELEARLAKYDRLKDSPESVMEEAGWTAEKYLERLATGKTPEPTVDDKVQSLTKEIDRLKKLHEDRETSLKTQTEQKAVADFKQSIKNKAEQHSERFEAIHALGEYDSVYATVEEIFQQTGKIPDIELVMDAVEKALSEKLEKSFAMKKYASKLKPTSNEATEQRSPQSFGGTLTAQTTATTQPPTGKRLTDDERMELAMAKLKFT